MITYEYRCGECGKQFTREERIAEHGLQGSSRPRCPDCNSDKIEQVHSSVYVKTSKKS